jgi:hypothetical protein
MASRHRGNGAIQACSRKLHRSLLCWLMMAVAVAVAVAVAGAPVMTEALYGASPHRVAPRSAQPEPRTERSAQTAMAFAHAAGLAVVQEEQS